MEIKFNNTCEDYETFEGKGVVGFYSKIDKKKKIVYLEHLKGCDYPKYMENNTINPCIYIYRNSDTGYNYVGQAKNITVRNDQHWSSRGKNDTDYQRFMEGKFNEIIVFRGDKL